jgi:hypothetical protein
MRYYELLEARLKGTTRALLMLNNASKSMTSAERAERLKAFRTLRKFAVKAGRSTRQLTAMHARLAQKSLKNRG